MHQAGLLSGMFSTACANRSGRESRRLSLRSCGSRAAEHKVRPAFKGYRVIRRACAFGESGSVHGIPFGFTEPARGDIISLDFGVEYKGTTETRRLRVPVGRSSPSGEAVARGDAESLIARLKMLGRQAFERCLGRREQWSRRWVTVVPDFRRTRHRTKSTKTFAMALACVPLPAPGGPIKIRARPNLSPLTPGPMESAYRRLRNLPSSQTLVSCAMTSCSFICCTVSMASQHDEQRCAAKVEGNVQAFQNEPPHMVVKPRA